jgi:hypothetical protein
LLYTPLVSQGPLEWFEESDIRFHPSQDTAPTWKRIKKKKLLSDVARVSSGELATAVEFCINNAYRSEDDEAWLNIS